MSDMERPALAIPQCQKCGSTDVRAIKMLCLATERVGTGAVVGAGGGHIGGGLSTTTAQTSLALSLKPGRKPPEKIAGNRFLVGIGCVVPAATFTGGGIAAALGSDSAFGIAVVILIAGMIANYLVDEPNWKTNGLKAREAWDAENQLYEHGWICVRCGHTWTP